MQDLAELLLASGVVDAPALVCGSSGRRLTYAGLAAAVAEQAGVFRPPALGGRKALVFHAIRNSLDDAVALLAALAAGHAVALVDPALSADRLRRLIAAYRPEFVVGSRDVLAGADSHPLLDRGSGTPAIATARDLDSDRGEAIHPDLAVLLSTSGTTGSAKFVRLSHANLWSNARAIGAVLGLTTADVGCAHLPLHYSYGLSVLLSHLAAGAATAVLADAVTEAAFWRKLKTFGCTSFPGVPSHFVLLRQLRVPRLDFAAVRFATQAGGKLDAAVIAELAPQLAHKGIAFFVMYGQTEASPRMATLPAAQALARLGSVGPALPGGRFEIVGPDAAVLPAGQTGEVTYSGPNVMLGYAETRADLARGDTQGGRLFTGDLGHLDTDGFLFIDGRKSRFAKVHGLRISLDDVERIVRPHGVAIALQDGEGICLFVKDGTPERTTAMVDTLRRELDIVQDAISTRMVDAFPLLGSGKIDYETLRGRLS